jgi:hypothetical protein
MTTGRRSFIRSVAGLFVPAWFGITIAEVEQEVEKSEAQVYLPHRREHFQAAASGGDSLILRWKLDDASGTTAADVTGHYPGTLRGTGGLPTWTTGECSGGLSFDSTHSEYVDCSNVTQLSGVSSFSLSIWASRTLSTVIGFVGIENSATQRHGILSYSDGKVYFLLANGSNTYGTAAFSGTGWHHLGMVYDGSQSTDAGKLKGYIDGSPQTLSITGPIPATCYASGAFRLQRESTSYRDGILDEIRVFSNPVSAATMSALFSSPCV